MKNTAITLALVSALAGLGLSQRASAECSTPLQVIGTSSPRIQTYSQDGKHQGDISKELVVGQNALDCDEKFGLVKVKLADDSVIWIRRSETRPLNAPLMVHCTKAPAAASDSKLAATSGAGPRC
jgi:hypothetical protein